ncbi:MAG: hypothetical protein ACI92E_000673 [Oceanicoccus sp.]|jgi:hypothetical protein
MSLQSIESSFKKYLANDAETSISLGMSNKLGELSDPSMSSHARRLSDAQQLLREIDNEKTADFYVNLDLRLISLYLQQDIFFDTLTFNGKLQKQQQPSGVDGISEGIFQLFINDPRIASERLDNILSRLTQAPDYLKKEIETLDTPVERWRNIEVEQAEGLPELFSSIVSWAELENYQNTTKLKSAVNTTNDALIAYQNALSSMPSTREFSIGEEKVIELLSLKEIEKTPLQLRDMAATFLQTTIQEIDILSVRLLKKYKLSPETSTVDLHDFLNKKFSVELKDGNLESVLESYQEQKAKLRSFVEERNLFPVLENQDIKIIKTPGFLEPVIPAGAMWPPVALRVGVKKSLVYLTLKEDELDEHTHLGIPLMMVHEGIPGHHLQFASASEQPSFIRKFFNAPEHAEGWTTMLEDYMLDQGLVEDEILDEVRFITKRDISRLGARVGIDLFFMTGDKKYLELGFDLDYSDSDPFVNAGKLLKKATGFTDGRVQAELNWYSSERGYPLSYLTGNRMVWSLKNDIVAANKKNLSLNQLDKEFHRIYLHSGCMPVSSLRSVYQHEGFL